MPLSAGANKPGDALPSVMPFSRATHSSSLAGLEPWVRLELSLRGRKRRLDERRGAQRRREVQRSAFGHAYTAWRVAADLTVHEVATGAHVNLFTAIAWGVDAVPAPRHRPALLAMGFDVEAALARRGA